jgi:Tfp pilus assembly protein FimV
MRAPEIDEKMRENLPVRLAGPEEYAEVLLGVLGQFTDPDRV